MKSHEQILARNAATLHVYWPNGPHEAMRDCAETLRSTSVPLARRSVQQEVAESFGGFLR
jgi:hypothetical protein